MILGPSRERSITASRTIKDDLIRAGVLLCCYAIIGCPYGVNAIGSIDEISKQSMVLQDVSFNVPNNQEDIAALQAHFQDKLKRIREVSTKERVMSVIGFGADAYNSPSSFTPGVSDFQEDGAHCTITLRDKVKSSSDDEIELFERGTGLEFLKVGVETLRLSKGIENGAHATSMRFLLHIDAHLSVYHCVNLLQERRSSMHTAGWSWTLPTVFPSM